MSAFRPIFPLHGSEKLEEKRPKSRSNDAAGEEEVRRRATAACLACKRRKIKCSGRPLPCGPCRTEGLDCVVDESLDGRRKASVKRIQEDLEDHRIAIQHLLRLLRYPGHPQLDVISRIVQAPAAPDEIVQCLKRIKDQQIDLELLPEALPTQNVVGPVLSQTSAVPPWESYANHEFGQQVDFLAQLQHAPEHEALQVFHQLRGTDQPPFARGSAEHMTTDRDSRRSSAHFLNADPSGLSRPSMLEQRVPMFQQGGPTILHPSSGTESPPLPADLRPGKSTVTPEQRNGDYNKLSLSTSNAQASNNAVGTTYTIELAEENGQSVYDEISSYASSVYKFPALLSEFSELLDDHVATIAVLQGWTSVKSQLVLDPQWEVLEKWHGHIMQPTMDKPDSLAALRMHRRMAKYLAAPNPNALGAYMPDFYIPIPCQKNISRSDFVHYVPWPALRELMVSDARYRSNIFVKTYLRSFHVTWPFEVDAMYRLDPSTSMIALSEEFTSRLFDINYWTLSKDMLDNYPVLRPFVRQFEPSLTEYRLQPISRLSREPEDTAGMDDVKPVVVHEVSPGRKGKTKRRVRQSWNRADSGNRRA